MRSSPSGPDPLDPGPAGFAHRGLHVGTIFPENGLTAFAAALELGAGIECDLRLTSDDRIVVFHDSDTRRMCGSSLRIGESSFDELALLTLQADHDVDRNAWDHFFEAISEDITAMRVEAAQDKLRAWRKKRWYRWLKSWFRK